VSSPQSAASWRSRPLQWDGATVAIRRLDDAENDRELSQGEHALVLAALSESRRKELRAGRAAAHEAFRAAGAPSLPEVLKADDERPKLAGSRGWYLSLAHDGDFAVAACDTHPIGVDFVPFRRAPQRRHINYYNLAMGNVTDGTILTFSIRSQNSTEMSASAARCDTGPTSAK